MWTTGSLPSKLSPNQRVLRTLLPVFEDHILILCELEAWLVLPQDGKLLLLVLGKGGLHPPAQWICECGNAALTSAAWAWPPTLAAAPCTTGTQAHTSRRSRREAAAGTVLGLIKHQAGDSLLHLQFMPCTLPEQITSHGATASASSSIQAHAFPHPLFPAASLLAHVPMPCI